MPPDIIIEKFHHRPLARQRSEIVERKGIGHPDSICDALHEKILRDMERGGMHLLEDRLSRVGAETLLIWGRDDRILHVSSVEKFQRGLKNNRTVILDNCGHIAFFERPEETVRACKDFLAGLQ